MKVLIASLCVGQSKSVEWSNCVSADTSLIINQRAATALPIHMYIGCERDFGFFFFFSLLLLSAAAVVVADAALLANAQEIRPCSNVKFHSGPEILL